MTGLPEDRGGERRDVRVVGRPRVRRRTAGDREGVGPGGAVTLQALQAGQEPNALVFPLPLLVRPAAHRHGRAEPERPLSSCDLNSKGGTADTVTSCGC